MTQQEILEYNKRCAEFLGWKKCLTHEFDRYNYCQTVDGYITPFNNIVANPQILEYNSSIFEHSISDMQFHSDWNWIMEVVEAIEKRGYCTNSYSSTSEENLHEFNIWNNITLEIEGRGKTKKEAVVQSINQFLIWYNNERKN